MKTLKMIGLVLLQVLNLYLFIYSLIEMKAYSDEPMPIENFWYAIKAGNVIVWFVMLGLQIVIAALLGKQMDELTKK